MKCVSEEYQIAISIELGLQTVNYHTLDAIDRGHSLAEYIDAVLMIQPYSFQICTHMRELLQRLRSTMSGLIH